MKKALSPIIATILVLMMTVAASATAFYWLTKVQGQMQGSTEQSQKQLFEQMTANVNVMSFAYNQLNDSAIVTLQNNGNTIMPLTDNSDGENYMLIRSEDTSCTFKLNTTTCKGCPSTLGTGATASFELWINASECSNLTEGKAYWGTFIFNKGSTSAISFVPAKKYKCGISLEYVNKSTNGVGDLNVSLLNYSINNTGNMIDTYTFTNSTSPALPAGSATINFSVMSPQDSTGARSLIYNNLTLNKTQAVENGGTRWLIVQVTGQTAATTVAFTVTSSYCTDVYAQGSQTAGTMI